jgi:hypothetical protein
MAVVGVISGTTFAWMFGALSWGVDFSRSKHPPYPSLAHVLELAQSQEQIVRHESVTDHELLELRMRDCRRDRLDAEIALAIHPDSRSDTNALSDANDCIKTLNHLITTAPK